MSFQEVELKKIRPNRLNPRLEFRKETLDELADSIERSGLVQPIVVRPTADGYEVVIGERRYRAAQQVSLDKVPAIVRKYTDAEVIELNLMENIHREDLSAVEKANACKQLRDRFPERYPTWEKVAEQVGVSFETVKSWVRTLDLPEEIRERIAPKEIQRVPKGKVDYQTALHIVETIKERPKQIEVARKLAQARVSQRVARQVIKEVAKKPQKSVEDVMKSVIEVPPRLPFMPEHVPPIRKGTKVQTSRKGIDPKIRVGAKVDAYTKFAELRVTNITRKRLADFTAEDARREGGYTLQEFKKVWTKLHGQWEPDEIVNVVTFKLESMTI
jgi:ParB family chromosome partitioning protein